MRGGGLPNVWGVRFFEDGKEILLLKIALKFGVIFQKYALKLIKIRKIIEKNSKKGKFFGKFLIFERNIIL